MAMHRFLRGPGPLISVLCAISLNMILFGKWIPSDHKLRYSPFIQAVAVQEATMDSSVDITPEEYNAMGDHGKEGASARSKEQDYVTDLVNRNRVVVFSKSQCPHCDDSKMLLSNMGVNYTTIELDKMAEGSKVQNVLGQITDARTVPRIFIDGQCVGGNSDLKTLNNSGALGNLLRDT